jgi:type IV secretion system protein VirB8
MRRVAAAHQSISGRVERAGASAMSADAGDLRDYFEEAQAWDRSRLDDSRRSARRAWLVAAAAWMCAVCAGVALLLLTPLKQVEPYLIRVDSRSGIVDTVPVYTGKAALEESVTRYFLTHYITVCERFNLVTAESDYEECGAFHGAQRNQAWYALWNRANPRSPLNLHKDGSVIVAEVESVSFFRRASGLTDLAQVRYRKSERQEGAQSVQPTHWIATIQYAFAAPSSDPRVRRWNPLGFKVIDFEVESETPEADLGAAHDPRGGDVVRPTPAASGSRP